MGEEENDLIDGFLNLPGLTGGTGWLMRIDPAFQSAMEEEETEAGIST